MKSKKNTRKVAVALLAGLAITGIVGASAASLGGIRGASLGADTEVVASCDTDGVDVKYGTSFDNVNDRFDVATITFGDVNDNCDNKNYEVVLYGTDAAGSGILAQEPGTVPISAATDFVHTFSTTPIDAELVGQIALVISG